MQKLISVGLLAASTLICSSASAHHVNMRLGKRLEAKVCMGESPATGRVTTNTLRYAVAGEHYRDHFEVNLLEANNILSGLSVELNFNTGQATLSTPSRTIDLGTIDVRARFDKQGCANFTIKRNTALRYSHSWELVYNFEQHLLPLWQCQDRLEIIHDDETAVSLLGIHRTQSLIEGCVR